ncbi:MAG: 16S rRNA (guanine(966)-N(2))-methyltransferase RsmD, partial [Fusobacteriaceae bacterium]
ESLFSIISTYVPDSVFLDLFTGTGNIALEALSRGAKRAVMIEQDPEALKIVIENINSLGYEDRCRAYKNDVIRAVEILGRKDEKFDIIFMDPPYKQELCTKVMKAIEKAGILAQGGLIICEHHIFEELADEIGEFKKADYRKYGKKAMTFFTR